jgi:phage anti-repressor protein
MDLIKKSVNDNLIQTVNARDLHGFLEVGRDFSSWIKSRIKKYEFIENEDYTIPKTGDIDNKGAKSKIEYYLTISMAKELALVQNNQKGREIRKYFIEVEKKYRKDKTKSLSYKEVRALSKEKRNGFTSILKDHGLNKPHHYIQITYLMKQNCGIERKKKKDKFDQVELIKIAASEMLATANILIENPQGYYEVKPICDNASKVISDNTSKNTNQLN